MSFLNMTDGGKSAARLEQQSLSRREAADALVTATRYEHQAVWDALDAGASWRDLAWLVGEPMGTLYHRHRDRGRPRVGRII